MLLKQWAKEKKDDTFPRKKAEEKQGMDTIVISVDGKGKIFPMKLKLEGKSSE